MKLLKSPYALLSLLLMSLMGVFSIDAYSITRVIKPNLHKGMQGGENCAMKSSNGSASQLNEINCMLNPKSCIHKIAWYQDRDNSMSPVSTKKGVGAAMATIFTKSGVSQGIQVCPGVYLATAHGVLDNPREARREERPQKTSSGNMYGMSPYPLSRKTIMTAKNDSSYVSPRIGNPSAWTDPSTDYVFIKVDNPLKPDHFVRPITSSDQRLVDASRRGEIDVHLYRPQTRFDKDSKGTPIFSKGLQAKTFEQISPLYNAPMRVDELCELRISSSTLIGSSCPAEKAVSGSPNTTNINGEDYLLGFVRSGDPLNNTPKNFENSRFA